MGQKVVLTGYISGEPRQAESIIAFEMEMVGLKAPPKGLPTTEGVTYTVLCTQKQLNKVNITIENLATTKLMVQGELTLDLSTSQCFGDVGLICLQLSPLEEKPKEEKQPVSKPQTQPTAESKPSIPEPKKEQPKYEDKVLHCVDCNADIIFTAEAQKFNAKKGFVEEPKRCLPCKLIFRQYLREHPEECEDGPIADFDYICIDCGRWLRLPIQMPSGRNALCPNCFKSRKAGNKPPIYYRQAPFGKNASEVEVPKIPVAEAPPGTDGWVLVRHIRVPKDFDYLNSEKTQAAVQEIVEKGSLPEPIGVTKDFVLVDGWRRLWIAEKMGWDRVPVKWVD